MVDCKIIRISEVMELTGLSRSLLYYNIRKKRFPAPIKISARASGWLREEVIAWLNQKIEERGDG